ncbi:MAG TPA: hypothetical protein VGR97_02695 [Candidatus Acidoferrales bacterium]|nr:hypothetical protein [Candidatus Acidoferrales bacterium]
MAEKLPEVEPVPDENEHDASVCPRCGRAVHPFDVLCPSCRATLVSAPTSEQLEQAEKLASIRSHLSSSSTDDRAARVGWQDATKSLLPVAVTLIVALGGWWITSTYNDAQLQVQKAQQSASRASSEASASLAYLQFLASNPSPAQERRDQALMAVAGVLPPELSFSLAAKRLPEEPAVLNLLLRIYGDQSWKYLSPLIEDSSSAQPILQLLHDQNVLDREFDWLIGAANDRPHRRLQALVSYFQFLRELDAHQHPEVNKPATRALVSRALRSDSIGVQTKSDLAAAAALVFVQDPSYTPDWDLLDMAANLFWEGIDTGVGELPQEGSLKYQLYFTRFRFTFNGKGVPTGAIETASNSLAGRLLASRLQDKTVYDLGRLMYSYSEEREYLSPGDALRFVRGVLAAVNSQERRKQFSEELGSLSGDVLYRNMSRDSTVRRQYADLIVDWYSQYATRGWAIPKFLAEVEVDYPDLKERIEAVFDATRPKT